jgi:hypothetical protein
MKAIDLTDKIKQFAHLQIDKVSQNTPIINVMKPVIVRALDNNIHKITEKLGLIEDSTGNIDVENIIPEMIDGIKSSSPFSVNSPIGEIIIGGGNIRFTIPYTNKELLFDSQDLDYFKEVLTN